MSWYNCYKLPSALDLFYQVAVKNIDLKELKEFKVIGDKIEAPKPVKICQEPKPDIIRITTRQKRMQN